MHAGSGSDAMLNACQHSSDQKLTGCRLQTDKVEVPVPKWKKLNTVINTRILNILKVILW